MILTLKNKFNVGDKVFTIEQIPLIATCGLCNGTKIIKLNTHSIRCPHCKGEGIIKHKKYKTWSVINHDGIIKSISYKKYINGLDVIKYNIRINGYSLHRGEQNVFNSLEEAQAACNKLNNVITNTSELIDKTSNYISNAPANVTIQNNLQVTLDFTNKIKLYTIKKESSFIQCTLCDDNGHIMYKNSILVCPACNGNKKITILHNLLWYPVEEPVYVHRYTINIKDKITVKYGLGNSSQHFNRNKCNMFLSLEDAKNRCEELNTEILNSL